jgi:hypothetical protein
VNTFWSYFWPPLGAGLAVGIIVGAVVFRSMKWRNAALALGLLASVLLAALWHGPLGGADRFSADVEHALRLTLINNEIPEVSAHLQRGPLTRRVLFSGPADDFQRSELVRIAGYLSGVESASWSTRGRGVPLIAEGEAAAILGFLFGLLVAYLRERRRRYNAEWNW